MSLSAAAQEEALAAIIERGRQGRDYLESLSLSVFNNGRPLEQEAASEEYQQALDELTAVTSSAHRRFFLAQTNYLLAAFNSRLAHNSMVMCSHFGYVLEKYSPNAVELSNNLIQKVCNARIKIYVTDELFAAAKQRTFKVGGD